MPIRPTPDRVILNDGGGYGGGTEWKSDGYEDNTGKTAASDSGAKNNYTTKTCKLVITYNKNGGTGNPPPQQSRIYSGKLQAVTMKETVKDNINGMTKTGSHFLGWATSASGEVAYNPGDVITGSWTASQSGTKTYTLYAVWTDTNTIEYRPDDNSNETQKKYSKNPLNTAVNLKGKTFTRDGYTQTGWATSKNGPKVYNLGQSVTFTTDDLVILYPVWTVNTYTVTLKPNGASGSDITIQLDYGSELVLPLTAYEKYGYHIREWNDEKNGTGATWIPGQEYAYTRPEDSTLYAIWEGNDYYVIYETGSSANHPVIDTVVGDLSSDWQLDANDNLYSDNVHLIAEGQPYENYLYGVHPGELVFRIDEENVPYSIAKYGSPFYTERRPYPKDKMYNSFDGWIADDGSVLVKSDEKFDAYTYTSDPIWRLTRDVILRSKWNAFYQFGKIFYGNGYSDEYGIYVEEPPSYAWPEHSVTHQKVNGKNGDVLIDLNRYENVKKTYKISAYDGVDFYSAARKVSEWLHRHYSDQYLRLEDSYEPDIYMLAIYEEANELENIFAKAGRSEISFNCKPQKFLISGDKEIKVANSGQIITNPTYYPAHPIIKFYGDGTITVNGSEIVCYHNYNGITFDSETYDSLGEGGYNMNPYMVAEDPVVLYPGENIITFEGNIYGIRIVPRWWRL